MIPRRCNLRGRKKLLRQYFLNRWNQERDQERFEAHLPGCFLCEALVNSVYRVEKELDELGLAVIFRPAPK